MYAIPVPDMVKAGNNRHEMKQGGIIFPSLEKRVRKNSQPNQAKVLNVTLHPDLRGRGQNLPDAKIFASIFSRYATSPRGW
jgi:hypothetical protein